jgi:hypothetical protein
MPIWMIALGVIYWLAFGYMALSAQSSESAGEKRAWNFAMGAMLAGGLIALALTT